MNRTTIAALLISSIMIGSAAVAAALTNGEASEHVPSPAAESVAVSQSGAAPDAEMTLPPVPPRPLTRRGDDASMAPITRGYPTFAQTPLPPVPQGSGWTWTYHKSRWTDDGCLEDKVSYGGAVYWLTACCCGYTMSRECPEEFCDE